MSQLWEGNTCEESMRDNMYKVGKFISELKCCFSNGWKHVQGNQQKDTVSMYQAVINQSFPWWLVLKLYKKQSTHLEVWNTDIYIYKQMEQICSLIKQTNTCSKSQIRHHIQTKSKKPLYVQLKIICMKDVMKNPAKVLGLHKSPSCIFQSHNVHRGLSTNIW